MSTLTTPVSSLGWLLSSIPMSTDQLTSSDKREIRTCTRSRLGSRTKPGHMRSLSYDPVNAWPRIKPRDLLLLSAQIRCLLASESTSESSLCVMCFSREGQRVASCRNMQTRAMAAQTGEETTSKIIV